MATTNRDWRGSIAADRNGRLNIKFKGADGRWCYRSTRLDDTPENRIVAQGILADVRTRLQAETAVADAGPVTVATWVKRWLPTRADLADRKNDAARLRLHVLPIIGDLRLTDTRPRHILEVVNALKASGHAPRTIRNVHSIVRALFRDAAIADLIAPAANPAILTSRQLGGVRDKRAGWRATAIYTRAELAALLWDERLALQHRVLWGLCGAAGLRLGEAAGLRWRCVDLGAEPLGRLDIVTSYDLGRTKTGAERRVPVHPSLAGLLAQWKLAGWAGLLGRQPGPDDLVVPVRTVRARASGPMVMKSRARVWFLRDLDRLGFRHRRIHDLRRTFISLCLEDGADEGLLKRVSHAPPATVMAMYTTPAWQAVCREVAKLQLERPAPGTVIPFPAAGER